MLNDLIFFPAIVGNNIIIFFPVNCRNYEGDIMSITAYVVVKLSTGVPLYVAHSQQDAWNWAMDNANINKITVTSCPMAED